MPLPANTFSLCLGPGFLSVSVYLYLAKQLAKQNAPDENENWISPEMPGPLCGWKGAAGPKQKASDCWLV